MDQSQAPLLDAVAAYHQRDEMGFTPPGHKQGRGTDPRVLATLGEGVFRSDLLATAGLDDRMSSQGVLKQAEELMADAVGAEHTFFTTCGSSLSVKAAMLAVSGPDEKLLVSRDAHKSVTAGLILAGIRPIWVEPNWDARLHLAHPPAPEAFEEQFKAHPDARGALVVSPTPYGTSGDLAAIAGICHARGRPLIVDEAWGAHLPFHNDLPTWAMNAGADICVTSVHKMGGAIEQSSVFHLQGGRVQPEVLQARADLLGTTSSSVLMYAALDGWRRQMAQDGHRLLDAALGLAWDTRSKIGQIDGLHVYGEEEFIRSGVAAEMDPLQLVIDVSGLGITGYQGADWLRDQHHIDLHVSDHRRASAQLSYADSEQTTGRLVAALTDLAKHAAGFPPAARVEVPGPADLRLELVHLPRDAFFARAEQVPADRAVGRVAAEMLTPYPPGVPAVIPGERITRPILDYLRSGVQAGMVIPDAADASLDTIRVMIE
jgi:arginine/lysine/ornithine decarboxylase